VRYARLVSSDADNAYRGYRPNADTLLVFARRRPSWLDLLAIALFMGFVVAMGGLLNLVLFVVAAAVLALIASLAKAFGLRLQRVETPADFVAFEKDAIVFRHRGDEVETRIARADVARVVAERRAFSVNSLRVETRSGVSHRLWFAGRGRRANLSFFEVLVNRTEKTFPGAARDVTGVLETVRAVLTELGFACSEEAVPTYPRVRYWREKA
jgi:hypothetical protein